MLKTVRAGLGAAALGLASTALAQAAPGVVTPVPAVQITVAQPSASSAAMLPSNTDIYLALESELTSKKAKVGDRIAFRVARDVMYGPTVVIPRGTPAEGRISLRSGKGVFGKSAKLEFNIESLTLAGRPVALSGHHRIAGDGNTGATVGAVVAAGVIGGLLVTGRSAVAAAGTEFKASTREPIAVTLVQ